MIVNDVEELLFEIRNQLIAGMDAVIDSINAEKGDTLLEHVDANEFHFFFRSNPTQKKIFNIYNGNVSIASNRQEIAKTVEVFVECAIIDNLKDDTFLKSLRYMRAMTEVLTSNAFDIENSSSIVFEQLEPFQILENDTFEGRIMSGLRLTVDFV